MFETIFYGTGFGRDTLSAKRLAYLLLIWVLVPMWLVMRFYTLVLGLAFTAGFSAIGEQANVDVNFRRPFFTWTGDIGLHDLRIEPRDRGDGPVEAIQARRVQLDMPNWGVMQSLAAAGDDDAGDTELAGVLSALNHMDHVGVSAEGVKADFLRGVPRLLRGMGLASGAPFETEGCARDTRWLATELSDMGIDTRGGVDFHVTLANDAEAGEIHFSGSLVSPHSSRIDFRQHFRATSLSAFLDAEPEKRIAVYERIAVDDDGFVAARDAFCARRDGVDRKAFTERHLAALRRRLEAQGLRAGPELERAYRAYLRTGTLVIEARPSASIPRSEYHHYAVADQQRMYNGSFTGGAMKPLPLRFDAVPARLPPAGFQGNAWDLVAFEATAGTTAPASPAVAEGAPALAAAATTEPAPSALVAVAIPEPVAARTTADGRALASSLPSDDDDERRGRPNDLPLSELGNHLGEQIAILTTSGVRREGRLESVGKNDIGLRVYVAAGYAIQHIDRSQIRAVRDLD